MTAGGAIPLPLQQGIGEVLKGIAEELAFAQAGSDAGLLAVSSLLMDLEDGAPGLPATFGDGLRAARELLDGLMAGAGQFTAEAIAELGRWHEWLVQWLDATAAGKEAPAFTPGLAAAAAPAPTATVTSHDAPAGAAFTPNLPADRELLGEFRAESLELLQAIEQSVLQLEDNPTASEPVHAIFRAFHTFKGSAGFLGLGALKDFAHELESLLEAVRSGRLAVSPAVIEAILAGADGLGSCVRSLGAQLDGAAPVGPIGVPAERVSPLIARALDPSAAAAAPVARAAAPAASAAANVAAPAAASAPAAAAAPAAVAAPAPAASAGDGDRSVRVDSAKLDLVVNLVGELVIAQTVLLQGDGGASVEREEAVAVVRRLTRALQEHAQKLRMVPISGLFRRMTRLVRDTARQVGKQVELVLAGSDTELDRQLVERLHDPLMHMLRNAIDHGIESVEDRIASGKNPTGTVRLSAAHAHGQVVIEVADDGKGIDGERLEAVSIERGLIEPGKRLSNQERLELLFLPGLSTAKTVTDLSGRGVGMDVVRREIEALRGSVSIASEKKRGTTFTIRVPLTLALIDGLIVAVAGQRYILPSLAVRECLKPTPEILGAVHGVGEVLRYRGAEVPVLRLGRFLGVGQGSPGDLTDGILVLVESAGHSRAVWVDELRGKQEMVIKTLGETFAGHPLVAGGAVLADGSVGLILGVDALVRAAVS